MPISIDGIAYEGIVKLRREPFDMTVLVELPDGSSEEIEGVDLVDYLEKIGLKEPDRCASMVWNLYKVDVQV